MDLQMVDLQMVDLQWYDCSGGLAVRCRRGPDKAEDLRMHYNAPTKKWTIPFLMAPINTRIVRRSNALLHHSYGESRVYK